MKAFAWKSGLIEFARTVPDGAIEIAEGPSRPLRRLMIGAARHGQGASEGKLLVPGIPEADMFGWDPVEKLAEFTRRLAAAKEFLRRDHSPSSRA